MSTLQGKIQYRVDLYEHGTKISEIPFDKVSYGEKYNSFIPGKLLISGDNITSDLFNKIQFSSEARVFREGIEEDNFRLVYAGELRNTSKSSDSNFISGITADLIPKWTELRFREFTKDYAGEQEEVVINDIVNTVQSETEGGNFTALQSNLGITFGNFDLSGNARDRTYTNDVAWKAITQLCEVNDVGGGSTLRGVRITPDMVIGSYQVLSYEAPFGIARDVTFGTESIDNFSLSENFEYANHIIAYGSAGLRAEAYSVNETNKNNLRKRTRVLNASNITTIGALQDFANEQLRIHETLPTFFEFNIPRNNYFTGRYRVGDFINVKYKDSKFDIDTQLRVFEIKVSFDSKGYEQVGLKVAESRPATLNISKVEKLSEFISQSNEKINDLSK